HISIPPPPPTLFPYTTLFRSPHRDQPFVRLGQIDPVRIAAEVRPATAHDRRDPSRGSARRGEPRQLVPGPGLLADARTARALDHHDALAVGRPHRVVVEGGLGRQALRLAATPSVGAHFLDVAPPVAPGDV